MSKRTLAVDNWAGAAKALEAWLPECRNVRIVAFFGPFRSRFNPDSNGYAVRGDLPSGCEYEVPIDVNLKGIYYDEGGAWINSSELARELKKAVRAFKVAIALEGSMPHDDSMRGAGCNCPRCQERKGRELPKAMKLVDSGVYGFSGGK